MSGMEKEMKKGDPTGMTQFMDHGIAVRGNGGIFSYNVDRWQRLETVWRQSRRNKEYLRMFGDYVAMDGTHLVDMYGHIMMIVTVIDSLGLAQVGGIILGPAEDADVCIAALDAFSLETGQDKVLHTDGGSWGPVVAAKFDRTHLLCANHYLTKVQTSIRYSSDIPQVLYRCPTDFT
jgi:hypothetical protein